MEEGVELVEVGSREVILVPDVGRRRHVSQKVLADIPCHTDGDDPDTGVSELGSRS